MKPPDVIVSAEDLSIEYRRKGAQPRFLAVKGVTLELRAGELLVLIGESGSGKSTIARAIAGLSGAGLSGAGLSGGGWPGDHAGQICGGRLEVLSTEMRGITRSARAILTLKIGYLPQDAAERLSPLLTVAENVVEPIFVRDRHFDAWEAAEAAAAVIDAVRLPLAVMDQLPHQLSSGQRQRVALARALILEPALLIADEPTRGVDASVRDGVVDTILDLRDSHGFAAIVISSDLAVLSRMPAKVTVLQHGGVIGSGSLDALLGSSAVGYLRELSKLRAGDPG